MAYLIRGKIAGVQKDLSAGISAEKFVIDDVGRYGINSRISAVAYDPVQSLMAVGTSETKFGSGQIYVFGRQRVSVVFLLPRQASCRALQFSADKLICFDSKDQIIVYSLESKTSEATFSAPGHMTAVTSDPCLDFAFLGLQNGEVVTYDLVHHILAPLRLKNIWKEKFPAAPAVPVVSLALHPRDIGTLLIGYTDGAVIFSLKTNQPVQFFQYELPPGAPGGTPDPIKSQQRQFPTLLKAVWHPTGTFILTVHDDSSIVFWDSKEGKVVMARSLTDINIDKPGSQSRTSLDADRFIIKEPIYQVAWCCKENPDDTGVLVAGGLPSAKSGKWLTFFDLGQTPVYQTSSWQTLSNHFADPKSISGLPIPPNTTMTDFCLIPQSSPFFAGAQNPLALVGLLSSGEIITLSFPSGHVISCTNMEHVSLSFVQPFVTNLALSFVDRSRWMGWKERRIQGPAFLNGGSEGRKPLKRFETRDIVQVAHADGSIRIWDAGHKDELENPSVLQIDLARAVGRANKIDVTNMSLSGAAGEFSAGLKTGEVAVFRWGPNQTFGKEALPEPNGPPGTVMNIMARADPNLRHGFVPYILMNECQGPVTALKHSDVGFVCAGFETGNIMVVDLRVPKIIFTGHISEFSKQQKLGPFRRHRSSGSVGPDWVTTIEFGVLTLENDDYSSIALFAGTHMGNLITFKILPAGPTDYTVNFAGVNHLNARVINISPIQANTGETARATQAAVSGLRSGLLVNGVVVAVTTAGCRIYKPVATKGAQKEWDSSCDKAAVVRNEESHCLAGLFSDGWARAYTIPGLKEIGTLKISNILDVSKLHQACITSEGDVVGWVGPSEIAAIDLFGTGQPLRQSNDTLWNPTIMFPPRPTISNFQWLSGTQYISPTEMSMLIGGPDRPQSKRMMAQKGTETTPANETDTGTRRSSKRASASSSAQSYWNSMQREVQRRTRNLDLTGQTMDRLEETSTGFVDDVDKYLTKQSGKMAAGFIGSKFGF